MISETLGTFAKEYECISIDEIVRKMGQSAKTTLKGASVKINNTPINLDISRTAFDGYRLWFFCPQCNRRCAKMYIHPITWAAVCRICLGLDYRSHRYWKMLT